MLVVTSTILSYMFVLVATDVVIGTPPRDRDCKIVNIFDICNVLSAQKLKRREMVELRRVPAHTETRDLLQPVLMLPCSSLTFLPWSWRTGVMSQSWRGARHIKKLFSAGLTGTGTESNIERPGVPRHFSLSPSHRYKGPGWCASPTGELNPQYLATVSGCACRLYGSIGQ